MRGTGDPAGGPVPTTGDASAALLTRLARLRERIAALVEDRAAGDPTADDPLRGLYVSEDTVRRLLRTGPSAHNVRAAHDFPVEHEGPGGERGDTADDRLGSLAAASTGLSQDDRLGSLAAASTGLSQDDRLGSLAARTGLTQVDTAILLLALAPDLDRGFETLYGYLNDDVGRRRATVGLVLDVCGLSVGDAGARERFHPAAPLVRLGLVRVEDPDAPFLGRVLRVPDRLLAHLLGSETPDPVLAQHLHPLHPAEDDALTLRLAALLGRARPPLVYLRERHEGDALACAGAALAAGGRPALHFSPVTATGASRPRAADGSADAGARTDAGAATPPPPVRELLLEARLRGCAVVVSPLPAEPAPLVAELAAASDVPVVLAGSVPYDPGWCAEAAPVILEAPAPRASALDQWATALGLAGTEGPRDGAGTVPGSGSGSGSGPGFDLATTVAPYRMRGDRVRRAARSALDLAAFDGTDLTADHVRLAARQHSASGLERHARRIVPDVGWQDLVLPAASLAHLRELAVRSRHRERVLGSWRLSAGGGRGRGVLALFAGESGTGKTLAAEVLAADLGLDLYVVQLSSVVDKYVGETEKNLERIFTEADRTDAVLLFDEADAVFGKRSEVKSSHDRYANLESAYLLQRLEAFNGVAVLTTNLRANIDDAFTRRLDLVVDFPFPQEDQRLALWRHSLTHVPCADDLDPSGCARDYELAGGSIRSAVVTAAYAAAARGGPVNTHDLVKGARREYRKAGRLVMEDVGW
ncbi:ATP-binding protein [Streptomyces sp. NPDC091272]|uniref:ATP-binding protein n=1 Tax=Streptomyces sp. NPDC091272 TaxID=3365981 RepID=UPI00381FB7B4